MSGRGLHDDHRQAGRLDEAMRGGAVDSAAEKAVGRMPPSTRNCAPVSHFARSEARKSIMSATSPGAPERAQGDSQVVHDLLGDRLGAHALLLGHAAQVGGRAVGNDEAGKDTHHAHAVLTDLCGQFPAVGVQRGLGGGVGRLGALGQLAGDRGDIHARPPSAAGATS